MRCLTITILYSFEPKSDSQSEENSWPMNAVYFPSTQARNLSVNRYPVSTAMQLLSKASEKINLFQFRIDSAFNSQYAQFEHYDIR